MLLYQTAVGAVVAVDGRFYSVAEPEGWDALFNRANLETFLDSLVRQGSAMAGFDLQKHIAAPIGSQEVWAAGVTYSRSRAARVEESKSSGGSTCYDRVYDAERPEIFFKATRQRVVGTGAEMHLRGDSRWMVPEPELTLAINSRGELIGFTVGNDLSCRDIEGENPLYLPQAKIFRHCAAMGPGILIANQIDPATEIRLQILRAGRSAFEGATTLSRMKRKLPELIEFLFRDNDFPQGCFLMTGTGIVPPDDFTLHDGDEVRITIDSVGTLVNRMQSDTPRS
ncbi:MAG TPA: fumarylacetoacetate hydrolase family protein [Planctomycetota bacterium]|nr:fumarylacetoacetate hydrolase family protein [Planctomycetota bacterium]